jgi:hypothetical protein
MEGKHEEMKKTKKGLSETSILWFEDTEIVYIERR